MAHSFLGHIQAAEKYIAGQTDFGLATTEDACKVQVEHLSDLARKIVQITQEQCTEIFAYLKDDKGMFTSDQRKTLAHLVNTRCTATTTEAGSASNNDSQTNLHLQRYYPDWLWSVIKSDDSVANKLAHTADFWVKHLGLRNACELTKRLGVAIVQAASDQPINPQLSYHQLHDLQDVLVRKRGSTPGRCTLKVFPRHPNEFWTQYPTSYSKTHPPAPCRIDEIVIFERNCSSCIPARDTNKRVSGKQETRPTQQQSTFGISPENKSVTDSSLSSALQMMMSFMHGQGKVSQLAFQDRPGIDSRDEPRLPGANVVLTTASSASSSGQVGGQNSDDRGGLLPGVLQVPKQALTTSKGTTNSSDVMAQIRANIKKTVDNNKSASKKQKSMKSKKSKNKKSKKSKKDTEVAAGDDTDDDAEDDADDDGDDTDGDDTDEEPKAKSKPKKVSKVPKAKAKSKSKAKKTIVAASKAKSSPRTKTTSHSTSKTRPAYSEKPTHYSGGRIYFAAPRNAFRVIARKGDRRDTPVNCGKHTKKDKLHAFEAACGLIEADKRPIVD